jgi:hypothetical protein
MSANRVPPQQRVALFDVSEREELRGNFEAERLSGVFLGAPIPFRPVAS